MADKAARVPENVEGPFYVDETCIDCDFCRETAPGLFLRNPGERRSYVARQPRDPEERAKCREALLGCPVEAIGDDGEPAPTPQPQSQSPDPLPIRSRS